MRMFDLVSEAVASMRLSAIAAGGLVLWLAWLVRNESGFWTERLWNRVDAFAHLRRRRERRSIDRPVSGSLAELQRLRKSGAI